MQTLYKISESIKGFTNPMESLELIYSLKAWDVLSKQSVVSEELSFENFYNQKIEVNKLIFIFEKLAKKILIFKLFESINVKLNILSDTDLVAMMNYVKNSKVIPRINDVFFNSRMMLDFSISNQIAELGIKLLNGKSESIYVPFTNSFAYAYFTDKKIDAEFPMIKNAFIAELMNILEDHKINFLIEDPLKNPSFINPEAPHLLKQFESVLSFPPFGLRESFDGSNDPFHRFSFHKGFVLDVAHFEHILAQTKGKAVVMMPVGFTYRASNEEAFRKYLIQKDWLEAIIQLPPNLHSATSIETTFFVINKDKSTQGKVYFLNLKSEAFVKRDGRQIVLNNIDEIVDLYANKKEIDAISRIISSKKIEENNYSFAIDRYVTSENINALNQQLQKYKLVPLETIADIRKSQLFKDEEEGKEVYELSPSDFSKSGFTMERGKIKRLGNQYDRYQTYKLQPYDVLLSTKGTIGRVGIVGQITEPMLASQAIQVIRLKGDHCENNAIVLYMFLKSDIGQAMLKQLVAGVAMPQIATTDIKKLTIPELLGTEKQNVILNFNDELKMYNKIEELDSQIKIIHSNFLKKEVL